MKRLFVRGAVLGLALWLVAPAPSAWAATTFRIQNPNDVENGQYQEWANSAIITGRNVPVHFEAYATSGLAWAQIDILGLPGWSRETIQRDPDDGSSYTASSGRGTSGDRIVYDLAWDTAGTGGLNKGYNGTFTIRYFSSEHFAGAADCSSTDGDGYFNCVDRKFRVNNPPGAVDWASGPSSSKDDSGRPVVHLSWSYGGNEPDMREFAILRDGSATPIAYMPFEGSGTYSFDDKSYADSGYAGSHSYSVMALRTSSVGPNKCSSNGTYLKTCIGKSSATRSITLVEPTGTGTGGGSTPGGTPGSTPGSGSKGSTNPGFRPAPVGTVIVGGRRLTSGCRDCEEFYQGTYSTNLPYAQNQFLLVPKPGSGGKSSNRLEALPGENNSAPLGVPLRDRSVLLPFAGGLLLFLAAAHVRRLLRRV